MCIQYLKYIEVYRINESNFFPSNWGLYSIKSIQHIGLQLVSIALIGILNNIGNYKIFEEKGGLSPRPRKSPHRAIKFVLAVESAQCSSGGEDR